jgi:hypothetical protein
MYGSFHIQTALDVDGLPGTLSILSRHLRHLRCLLDGPGSPGGNLILLEQWIALTLLQSVPVFSIPPFLSCHSGPFIPRGTFSMQPASYSSCFRNEPALPRWHYYPAPEKSGFFHPLLTVRWILYDSSAVHLAFRKAG